MISRADLPADLLMTLLLSVRRVTPFLAASDSHKKFFSFLAVWMVLIDTEGGGGGGEESGERRGKET